MTRSKNETKLFMVFARRRAAFHGPFDRYFNLYFNFMYGLRGFAETFGKEETYFKTVKGAAPALSCIAFTFLFSGLLNYASRFSCFLFFFSQQTSIGLGLVGMAFS